MVLMVMLISVMTVVMVMEMMVALVDAEGHVDSDNDGGSDGRDSEQ